jgi:hypothetical protein
VLLTYSHVKEPSEMERPFLHYAEIEMDGERRLPPRLAVLVYLALALLAWALLIAAGWALWTMIF